MHTEEREGPLSLLLLLGDEINGSGRKKEGVRGERERERERETERDRERQRQRQRQTDRQTDRETVRDRENKLYFKRDCGK